MKSSTRLFSDVQKLGTAMSVAGTNVRKTQELLAASGQVVAKRMTLGAAALVNPATADHAEFARMVPEKAKAFSEAGAAWLRWSGAISGHMSSFVSRELLTATQAAAEMALCRTPTSLAAAQHRFATAWFARAVSHSIALGSLSARSHSAAMAPVHRAATANARRLGR
jgi:hypothetical protein